MAYHHIMHKVQTSILKSLRRSESATFSALMKPTGLLSDAFKFHLQKLVHAGYVCKLSSGEYCLTTVGKEFANNLDNDRHTVQKQPKLSVILIISRETPDGSAEYLLQKRLRNPFLNFWGLLSGPVKWGELPEETAQRELRKQTGLQATFEVGAFYRQRDYQYDTDQMLEDKLFAVLIARSVRGSLANDWSGGHNSWKKLNDWKTSSEKLFPATNLVITAIHEGRPYIEKSVYHQLDDY